ncbi:hypothetical protein HU200_062417 [Digitaria exilis]|uniref:Uncharacterized protein n=1 Tax=Digitaria exilis TaxID=1010633 RepID=A0A835E0E6_9POAL|nr:hypothetical protein HU200_062417 [Digitaria exilis]
MASNKALLLLALLAFAAVLATAADHAGDDKKTEKMMVNDVATGVEDWHGSRGGSDQYSHGCEYGCCHRVYHGGCQRCCQPGGASTPEVNN